MKAIDFGILYKYKVLGTRTFGDNIEIMAAVVDQSMDSDTAISIFPRDWRAFHFQSVKTPKDRESGNKRELIVGEIASRVFT